MAMQAYEAYLERHRERHLAELLEFVRIPSVSALPAHGADMQRAAQWVAAQLQGIGVPVVEVLQTPYHPIVYGEWLAAPGAPTVLIYAHYDVQPPDPAQKWLTPPFEPTVRDGRIYARGVSDDKGPMVIAFKALETLVAVDGRLPLNVKFLIEGEEEINSPSLRPFVQQHAERLAADLVISADGAMWRPTEPSLNVAARGMCGLQIDLSTAGTDLHSGRHGGGVPNAIHALTRLVAALHDENERVTVEGFYDRVRELDPAQRAQIAALPFEEEAYRRDLQLEALVGEAGYTTLERQWARPTLECNGIWGGFQGEGTKTVIPAEAHAKITCRLVANQDPGEIVDLLEAHIRRHTPPGARIAIRRFPGSAVPYEMPSDLPALRIAGATLEEVFGKPPLYVRIGATLPAAEVFWSELGVHMLFFSFSTADELFHAPNEFFRLDRFDQGLRSWVLLLQRLRDLS